MPLFRITDNPGFACVSLRTYGHDGYSFESTVYFEGCFFCNLLNLIIEGAHAYEFEVFSVRTIQTFQGA